MPHTYSTSCPDCGGGPCNAVPLAASSVTFASESSGSQQQRRELQLSRRIDGSCMPIQTMLSTTLWNIANLGGGFGFPAVRDDAVIFAIAAILHQARTDVCVILELMEHALRPRKPCTVAYNLEKLYWYNFPIDELQFQSLVIGYDRGAVFSSHPDAPVLHDLGVDFFWERVELDKLVSECSEAELDARERGIAALKDILAQTMDGFWSAATTVHPELGEDQRAVLLERFRKICMSLDSGGPEKQRQRELEYAQKLKLHALTAKHSGIRELLRIRDAMNAIAGTMIYDCWPPRIPAVDDNLQRIYTHGETYGYIYRRDRCRLADVLWLRKFPGGEFTKRAPLLAVFRVAGGCGFDAQASVLAYHAPSDSERNTAARTADFRALIAACNFVRKMNQLVVLASDLNINTLGTDTIGHCDLTQSVGELFDAMTNVEGFLSSTKFHGGQTTLRCTAIQPPLLQVLNGLAKDRGLPLPVVRLIEQYARHTRFEERYNAFDKIAVIGGHSLVTQSWENVVPLLQALALESEARLFMKVLGDRWWLYLLSSQCADQLRAMRALVPDMAAAMRAYANNRPFTEKLEMNLMLQLLKLARLMSDHIPITASYCFGAPTPLNLGALLNTMSDQDDEYEDEPEPVDTVAQYMVQDEHNPIGLETRTRTFHDALTRLGLREGYATPRGHNCLLHTMAQFRAGEWACPDDFGEERRLLGYLPHEMIDMDEHLDMILTNAGLHVQVYVLADDGNLEPGGVLGAAAAEDGSNVRYMLHYGAHYEPLWKTG